MVLLMMVLNTSLWVWYGEQVACLPVWFDRGARRWWQCRSVLESINNYAWMRAKDHVPKSEMGGPWTALLPAAPGGAASPGVPGSDRRQAQQRFRLPLSQRAGLLFEVVRSLKVVIH